jgi:hypothetical protein
LIKLTKAHQVTHKVNQLEKLLLSYPGDTPVFLHYSEENKTKQLSAKYNISPTLEFIKEAGKLLGPNSVVVKEE